MQNNYSDPLSVNREKRSPSVKPMIFDGIKVSVSNRLLLSKQDMSVAERHLLAIIYAQINTGVNTYQFPRYKTSAKTLGSVLGINGRGKYTHVKRAVNGLFNRDVVVCTQKDRTSVEEHYRWFQHLSYERGTIYVEPDPKLLKDHCLNLKRDFTTIKLDTLLNLSTIYALRLYEVICVYIGQQHGGKARYEAEEPVKISIPADTVTELLTTSKTHYSPKDLTRYVIRPAMEEINHKTEMTILDIQKRQDIYGQWQYDMICHKKERDSEAIPMPADQKDITPEKAWENIPSPEALWESFLASTKMDE